MRVSSPSDQELIEVGNGGVYYSQLASGEHMSAEYFRVEPGCGADGHCHEYEQMGVMLGEQDAVHTFVIRDTEEHELRPGDSYYIPSNEPHRVTNHSESAVEIINFFSPPRGPGFLKESIGTPHDT